MAQSRQTPRVWSDAIRGFEILANWVKLGSSTVVLWLSIGIALGALVGGFWFVEGTTSLDRKLWVHYAAHLGHGKNEPVEKSVGNTRNGNSRKTLTSELRVGFPRCLTTSP
jgi:hypothetical protein